MKITNKNGFLFITYTAKCSATGTIKRMRINTKLVANEENLAIAEEKCNKLKNQQEIQANFHSKEEIEILINKANGMFKNFLALIYHLNVRPIELIPLEWNNIDFEAGSVVINNMKDGSTKKLSINKSVDQYLKDQMNLTKKYDSNVFLNKNKEAYKSTRLLSRMFKTLLIDAGIQQNTLSSVRYISALRGAE